MSERDGVRGHRYTPRPRAVLLAVLLALASIASGAGSPGRFAEAAAPDDSTASRIAYSGRAVLQEGARLTPLYHVRGPGGSNGLVGWTHEGDVVTAVDGAGRRLWSRELGPFPLFGGFDFDADGWPDLGQVADRGAVASCGDTEVHRRGLRLIRGRSGESHEPLEDLDDLCWSFPGATYATRRWTELAALGGIDTPLLAVQPQYASRGSFLEFSDGAFHLRGRYVFPSVREFSAYPAAQPNPWDPSIDHVPNSQIAVGTITRVGAEPAFLFFTSGRTLHYRIRPLSSAQLVSDRTFLNGGRTDLGGRHYGLVIGDPSAPERVYVLAGTSSGVVLCDVVVGRRGCDDWGGIERHVTRYDAAAGTVRHRFVGSAHDGPDGRYEDRLAWPANPFVPGAGAGSRIAYSVYSEARWRVHISVPGGLEDAVVMDRRILWDIADLDGDGTAELITSPTGASATPDSPGDAYLPLWRTDSYEWNEGGVGPRLVRTDDGLLPWLLDTLGEPGSAAVGFRGRLPRAARVMVGGTAFIAMLDPALQIVLREAQPSRGSHAGLEHRLPGTVRPSRFAPGSPGGGGGR